MLLVSYYYSTILVFVGSLEMKATQPTFLMKHKRGAEKGGEQISSSQKKKTSLRRHNTI